MTIKVFDQKLKSDKAYWDLPALKKLLSYGAKGDTFIAQSPRNYGKTYSGMMLAKESLENGHSIAWGRYNKSELSSAVNTWLDFCPELIPIKSKDNEIVKWFQYPDGGQLCFFTWNISQNAKGIDHPFEYIICDEFIPERYTVKTRYDTEFSDWTSVYFSLARSYNPTVIMFSNNIQWYNPFFMAWEIMPFGKGKVCKSVKHFSIEIEGEIIKSQRVIVVENVAGTKEIIKRNLKQQAIKFNSDEDVKRYFDNETKQEYTAIGVCPDKSITLSDIQIMSDGYYMRYRQFGGLWYWAKVNNDNTLTTYTSEPQYVDFSTKTLRSKTLNQSLEEMFNSGLCVFDSADTLMAFMRFLRHNRQVLSI